MATIIEREQPVSRSERYVEVDRSGTGGWVLAIVLVALVALGLLWWMRYYTPAASTPAPSAPANINVTVPGTSGGTGGGGSGATTNGSGGTGGATNGSGTQY